MRDIKDDGDTAVVDIGAGSVRLVTFVGGLRHPLTRINRKVSCGLGDYGDDGQIRDESVVTAEDALRAFARSIEQSAVRRVRAVATAGVRNARNGAQVHARLEAALGHPILLLSGADEGRLAADGVRCVLPDARGLIADLGSGSLEIGDVAENSLPPRSFPVGVLALRNRFAAQKRDGDAVIAHISSLLGGVPSGVERVYLIGGSWRALAAAYREQAGYPLRILHNYRPDGEAFAGLARVLAGRSAKFCASLPGVPKKRAENLPYAAAAAVALLDALRPREIVISAAGIREGVFYRALSDDLRACDPLISAAEDAERRYARLPGASAELERRSEVSVEPSRWRLWRFICRVADVAGFLHPDNRAAAAARLIVFGPFQALSHRELLIAALAVAKRCDRGFDAAQLPGYALLTDDDLAQAKRFTALLREYG